MARKTTTTPLEQISSDLKLAESKKHELSRAFQDLQSLSSSIFTLTVQWQDLQSDFDAIEASLKNGIQEMESKEREIARKVQSVEARIKNVEARKSEFAVRFGKLEDSEREFAVRSSKMEDCERRVKSLEKEVARKEQSVEARIKNFEAREREFAVRFSKLKDGEARFKSLENWNHDAMKGKALQLVLNERIDVLQKSGDVILAMIKMSSDPAKLVLDAMEGFYPLPQNGGKEFELGIVRRSCVLLLEQLLRDSPPIMPNVRKDAKRIAREWKRKMGVEKWEAWGFLLLVGVYESEVLGFLLLVGVYELVPEFDKDEIVKLFGAVAKHRLASELRRVLGITDCVAASKFHCIAWTSPLDESVKGGWIRNPSLLIGVYGLVPEFVEEILKLFGVVAKHRLASELRRVLGITDTDSVAAPKFRRIAWTPHLDDFVKGGWIRNLFLFCLKVYLFLVCVSMFLLFFGFVPDGSGLKVVM